MRTEWEIGLAFLCGGLLVGYVSLPASALNVPIIFLCAYGLYYLCQLKQ